MSDVSPAARRDDLIKHNASRWFGLFAEIAATVLPTAELARRVSNVVRAARLPLVALGPKGWVALGVSFAVEWVVTEAAIWAATRLGEEVVSDAEPGIGIGSPDTFTNRRKAARVDDWLVCLRHAHRKVAQGSDWVNINLKPAGRKGDRIDCTSGGKIAEGSPDVLMGGPQTAFSNRHEWSDYVGLVSVLNTRRGQLLLALSNMNRSDVRRLAVARRLLREGRDEILQGQAGEGLSSARDAMDQWWSGRSDGSHLSGPDALR